MTMRMKILMLVLALAVSAPLFAQDDTKKDDEKKTEKPAADEGEKEAPKREMTEDGKKLYADVKLVYAKFYELALAKVKANEAYKSDDIWAEAIKVTKNAKYKDTQAFHKAITDMKRSDRVFKKDVQDLMTDSAKQFAKDVEDWTKEQKK